jgi:hypothetical protein
MNFDGTPAEGSNEIQKADGINEIFYEKGRQRSRGDKCVPKCNLGTRKKGIASCALRAPGQQVVRATRKKHRRTAHSCGVDGYLQSPFRKFRQNFLKLYANFFK